MSWEEMSRDESPCPCGKGKYVLVIEMDDWNRSRSSRIIECPHCLKKSNKASKTISQHRKAAERFRETARRRARSYLSQFLAQFDSMTKRQVWERLFAGQAYPAMGTFYQHVRHRGSLAEYLEEHFLTNAARYFPSHFNDAKIVACFKQAAEQDRLAEAVARENFAYLPRGD